jgi:Fe-Mn family superoxide dismutase
VHKTKTFDLKGLNGISDKTLEIHFKLYEGYVKEANKLDDKLASLVKAQGIAERDMTIFSELKRRLGFEYGGMVLHEYYFANLSRSGNDHPAKNSIFSQAVKASFGNHEKWKADFVGVGKMRGVGWAICCQDPVDGRLSNHWIGSHEEGYVARLHPVLVMDVWEHAFILDYKPAERGKYIEAFFSNIDWTKAGVLYRRPGRGAVQAGSLPLLRLR